MNVTPELAAPRSTQTFTGSIPYGILLIVVVRASGALSFGLTAALGGAFGEPRPLLPAVAGLAAGAIVAVAIVVLAIARASGVTLRELGWRWDAPWRDLALGAAGALACVAVVAGVYAAAGQTSALLDEVRGREVARWLLLAILGVEIAFVEESLFRGYLQPRLMARLGATAGVLATAALFSLSHLRADPVALASRFAFGLVFGLLCARTRSLSASATAHAMAWMLLGMA